MTSVKHALTKAAGLFGKRLELCCPGGAPHALVAQYRRDGLHFGRLR